jgi:hypothetical protein
MSEGPFCGRGGRGVIAGAGRPPLTPSGKRLAARRTAPAHRAQRSILTTQRQPTRFPRLCFCGIVTQQSKPDPPVTSWDLSLLSLSLCVCLSLSVCSAALLNP